MTTAPAPSPKPAAPSRNVRRWAVEVTKPDTSDVASLLYMGAPKSGKTKVALSWPNPFVVYWDNNRATLLAHPGIPFVVPESRKQWVEEILPWMVSDAFAIDHPAVQTIVFDTFSMFATHQEMEVRGKAEMMDVRGGDWQTLKNRHISDFNALARLHNGHTATGTRYNMVVTCHEQEQYGSAGDPSKFSMEQKVIGIKPLVGGQMASLLAGQFDLVLCLERKVETITQPGKPATLRTRYIGRALERPEHKNPAGGTLWGKTLPSGELDDVSYAGLRRLCGLPAEVASQPKENP